MEEVRRAGVGESIDERGLDLPYVNGAVLLNKSPAVTCLVEKTLVRCCSIPCSLRTEIA
jgi:hypothetical protein